MNTWTPLSTAWAVLFLLLMYSPIWAKKRYGTKAELQAATVAAFIYWLTGMMALNRFMLGFGTGALIWVTVRWVSWVAAQRLDAAIRRMN